MTVPKSWNWSIGDEFLMNDRIKVGRDSTDLNLDEVLRGKYE